MKHNKNIILIALLFALALSALAQESNSEVDSLNTLARNYLKIDLDTSLIYSNKTEELSNSIQYKKGLADAFFWKAVAYRKQREYSNAVYYSLKSVEIRIILNDTLGLAKAYGNLGLAYFGENKFDSALVFHQKCLKQYLFTRKTRSIAIAYNNIGSVQLNLGEYKNSIINFQKAMQLFDEINLIEGTASCLLNIGQIYDLIGNLKDTVQNNKALEYYNKALSIYLESNNQLKIGETYNAIGIQYDQKATIYGEIAKKQDTINNENTLIQQDKYYNLAINELSKANKIFTKINYLHGISQITNNIGTIYMNQNSFEVALQYLNKALESNIKVNNTIEIATNYLSIAKCYRKMQEYKRAIKTLNKGMFKVSTPVLKQHYYEEFAITYNKLNNFKEAYKNHIHYTDIKDSLLKADNLITVNEVQAVYKTEIKDKQLKISEANVREQKALSNKRKIQNYAIGVIAILLLLLVIFILRSLKQKKRNNINLKEKNARIIEQNKFITHQKNEITSSITYARSIQNAVLPQKEYTNNIFKDHFILFKPQHIVSGDFFWVKELKDKNIVIATAADCTGHGVPGAFMSMLGLSFLNEISTKNIFINTGEILDQLRKNVISALHQTGKEGEQKDGMDMSIIAWNKKNHFIEFSGANNPLYLIRNKELIEFKGDKMPIGIHVKMDKFSSIQIPIEEGDCFYLFSDGYADQFGGPKGKKFKYKPFKRLLIDNAHLPMNIQKEILNKAIEDWKAFNNPYNNKPFEQIDDIVVFGIRF